MKNNRTKMFVPSNFTVGKVDSFRLLNCMVFEESACNEQSFNLFKHNFTGTEIYEEWDVYIETSKAEFLDKLDNAITGEELLV